MYNLLQITGKFYIPMEKLDENEAEISTTVSLLSGLLMCYRCHTLKIQIHRHQCIMHG